MRIGQRGYIELLVLVSIILMCSWATYQRNFIWKTNLSLWSDVVKKSPYKARPYIWVGLAYQKAGLINEAISQYKKALSLNPNLADAADAHNNLGLCYFDKGLLNEAVMEFEHAIRIIPNYIPAHNNLGFIYIHMKRYKKALKEFNAILKVNPGNNMAKSLVYFCHRRLKQSRLKGPCN